MRKNILMLAAGIIAFSFAACNNPGSADGDNVSNADTTAKSEEVYEATLQSLNDSVVGGATTGTARFVIADGKMTVTIDVKGANPNTIHWQHFHGFEDGQDAQPVTMSADANGDGIVDVTETGKLSGTTMVPFNKLPAEMNVGSDTYPTADADGNYHYEATIPMDELTKAFSDAFGGQALDLDKRVLYIHGVPDNTKLPTTVKSIADIPAQVTIPIACGKITKVNP